VETSGLCVGEERVRPPDAAEHLVANTQLVVAVVESQPLIVPVLAEVEIQREVLHGAHHTASALTYNRI